MRWLCVTMAWALAMLSVSSVNAQELKLDVREELTLDVMPCTPGFYCGDDGTIESCPQGSQHVLLKQSAVTEFAVCATEPNAQQARLLYSLSDEEAEVLLDVAFSIDLPVEEHALGDFWSSGVMPLLEASAIVDASYQEYLGLDVASCPRGFYCPPADVEAPTLGGACPIGSYGPEEGLLACAPCPPGLSTLSEGAYDVRNCTRTLDGGIASGQWIQLSVPPYALDDAQELAPQLAAYYGVGVDAIFFGSS